MQFGTHKLVNCCLLIITVTLLDSLTLGVAIKLACYMVHRPDRSREDRNSKVGVYACVLMIGAVKNKNSRQPLLRDLKVKCSQMQTLLPPKWVYWGHANCSIQYIPPDANANSGMGFLHSIISSQQDKYLQAVHIIAESFNHADVKTVLPKSHQLLWNVRPQELKPWTRHTPRSKRATGLSCFHTWRVRLHVSATCTSIHLSQEANPNH